MGYVFQETLRLSPPAAVTTMTTFQNEVQLGKKLRVQAQENLIVNIMGLHLNSDHWQRPMEFLPDRFDLTHPLSRTPKGDRRSSYAWLPFNGGKRICFGKTFAECVIKVKLTMMTQMFDMKFSNAEGAKSQTESNHAKYYPGNLPLRMIGQSHIPELWIELRERNTNIE